MATAEPEFRWRSVLISALLPTVLFSTGQGAILPIIPVVAKNDGASLALAGLVATMIVLGQVIGDIPSGALIARIGERTAMLGAAGLAIVGLVIALFAPNPIVLGIGILIDGVATAVFALARHAFMTSFVPLQFRARALSTLGGSFRLGSLLGPFIGAGVIKLSGDPRSAFLVQVVACIAVAIVLVTQRDPTSAFERTAAARAPKAQAEPTAGREEVAQEARGLFPTLWRYRRVLLTLGIGSMAVAALRQSRQVVLPLWGVSIGLDETQISLIIGVAGAVDFTLFFAGGWIMDRFGRLWTVIPTMLGLGIGHIALSLTHALPERVGWYIGIALFLSLANGLGAGILMTIGADLADRRNPAPFLGAWRFNNDVGGALGPGIVSGLTALLSLSFAVGALGVIGLIGAGILWVFVPRFTNVRPGREGVA